MEHEQVHRENGSPEKDKGLTTGATAQALGIETKTDSAFCADLDAERKAYSTVRAEAALVGCVLHELGGGGFLLSRWNYSREIASLHEVRQLLRTMGSV